VQISFTRFDLNGESSFEKYYYVYGRIFGLPLLIKKRRNSKLIKE